MGAPGTSLFSWLAWRNKYRRSSPSYTAVLPFPASTDSSVHHSSTLLNMKRWMKMMRFIGGLCLITLVSIAYVSYLCHNSNCSASERFRLARFSFQQRTKNDLSPFPESALSVDAVSKSLLNGVDPSSSPIPFEEIFGDRFAFDISGRDVIVFLHIQKTGGTIFGRHLVKDLNLEQPCFCPRKRKRCDCFRPNNNEQWLFSRYSTGWKCGLHADWTELTDCVEDALNEYEGSWKKRRYFYITVLRDPVHRYLSEFLHVQRGATWKSSRHWCGGKEFSDLPLCYKGANWTGVEMDEFMNCTFNLANNRQTRMLADLNLIGCYNSTLEPAERDKIMLASAKANLARMAYFGLTEQQTMSQYIFEETFRLEFLVPFEQYNATLSALTLSELPSSQLEHIRQLNHLDVELYNYAHQLLEQRYERFKARDPHFEQHLSNILNRSINNTWAVVSSSSSSTDSS